MCMYNVETDKAELFPDGCLAYKVLVKFPVTPGALHGQNREIWLEDIVQQNSKRQRFFSAARLNRVCHLRDYALGGYPDFIRSPQDGSIKALLGGAIHCYINIEKAEDCFSRAKEFYSYFLKCSGANNKKWTPAVFEIKGEKYIANNETEVAFDTIYYQRRIL